MTASANRAEGVILFAEDNPADQEIIKMAFDWDKDFRNRVNIVITESGVETMNYLQRQGVYGNEESSPRPDLVVLDINMPLMDGLNVLNEIRNDEDIKDIPVIIFTTSRREKDIKESYSLGATAYLTKPDDVDDYIWMIKSTAFFWMYMASLPQNES